MFVYRPALSVPFFRLQHWQPSAEDATLSGCAGAKPAGKDSTGTENEKHCTSDLRLHRRSTTR